MTPVPVSIAGDVTWGPSLHVLAPPDTFDRSAPMDWSPGVGTHELAIAKPVMHKSQPIVLDGHDLGWLLPHSGEEVIARITSSRKPIYAAATVKMNGKPTACLGGPDNLLMHLCGSPFKFPAGLNDTNMSHTVYVGLSELDKLRGDLVIASEAVKDFLGIGADDEQEAIEQALGLKKPSLGEVIVDLAASTVVSAATGWEEPIGAKISAGSPVWSIGAEVKWLPGEGIVPSEVKLDGRAERARASAEMNRSGSKTSYRSKPGEDKTAEHEWTVL